MHRKLTIISMFAVLFAFAPPAYAQTDCGDVTPTTATAFDCTSTTGDAALNISGGVPDSVTDNPVVTVNSTTGSATLTSYNSTITTTQTGGDTVVIGGAIDATFRTDDKSSTTKGGSDGNVVTITAGTGNVDIDIHNVTEVKIGGTGGNGIIATSTGGKVVADFSNQGIIVSDKQGTNGLIANTVGGDIELSFSGIYSAIHLYGARSGTGKEDTVEDTRGATLTSASGDITVELIDSAAIIASSVGESYGLAASTAGTGSISMVLMNDTACILGKDGIIANTVSGNIDLALTNGVVYGRGGKGSTLTGGNGIIATSTSGGDINIGGNGGSVIFADGAGSIAIEASTTGTLSVVAGEADGLSVWTEGGFAAINASTVNIVGADVGGNGSDFAILATGDVDVSGADVWTNKTEATTISTTGAVNVWNASKVRATGATANAISATTVVVNGSEVWTEGDTSNSIVTETLNVSNGGKVWANGAGSSAVSAGDSGTVNIVADDATGEVWTTVGGASTVKATTAYINDGVKVWANGAGSQAVSATTATVNGMGTQVWTSEGGTADTIVATTVNIWNEANVWSNGATSNAVKATTVTVNGAKVWSSGATSNTVVTETLNVSNQGKVWANGTGSAAVSAGSSGTVNIVADDATGEVWAVGGFPTVVATTAYINDGVKVWANGARTRAVEVTTATVNGAGTQVWTEGDTTVTISGASTVNIWNGANVWANGDTSNAVRATATVTVNDANVWSNGATSNTVITTTLNISGGGKVWAEGTGSSAVYARGSITANIVSADGDGQVWTTVNGVSTVGGASLAYINDGVKVWANGAGSQAVAARTTATVNSTDTQVWTEGNTTDTIVAPTVNIWNGADVWANGVTSNAVTATTSVTVNGAKVWSNGATSNTVVTATLNVSNEGKVWAEGATSSAVSAGASGTVNIVADDATGQVWTTVGGVPTVKATTAYINDGVKVWANGAGSQAASATTATVNGTGTQVWTSEGGTADTIVATTVNIWNEADVWANGVTSNTVTATTVTVNGAKVWSNGATSNSIVTETLNVSNEGKVWAEGATSSAVSAGTSGTVNIVADDATGQVWTTVGGVSTVKATTAYINDGVKVWANGAESQAVAATTATVNSTDTQVWTEGNTTDTIVAPTVSIWNGADVWANGVTSNAVTATTSVTVNNAKVWSNGATSNSIVTETLNVSNEGKVWAEGTTSSAVSAGTSGTVNIVADDATGQVWTTVGGVPTVKATTAHINDGVKVWANGAGSQAVAATTATVNGMGTQVWTSEGGTADTILATTVNIWNKADVWANGVTSRAVAATTVTVNDAQVWSNGASSNTVVTATLNVSNEGKVWAVGTESGAVAAGTSGTVNIVADDATGQVWTTVGGVHTVEGAEVFINDGVKVWANGAGSAAVASVTTSALPSVAATVNGTGTQVWAEGDTSDAVSASRTNIWNGANVWSNGVTSNAVRATTTVTVNNANVWSNGATSNTIVAATLNISGGGKVWAEGATSSAVAARSRINANIVSADGDGQVWTTVDGVSTVKDASSAFINDGVKVWANGAGSQAVSARTTATVNSTGTQVWTEGNTTDTIVAPTVSIWNGADVWSNGVTSNTVTATTSVTVNGAKVWSNGATSSSIVTATLNVSNEGKVWAEGTGSSAVSAGASGTVNVVADDATGEVWTTVDGVPTVKGTTAYINDGVKVWANGAGSQAVSATTAATVNSTDTQVWTEGGATDTIVAPTVNIWNGANVWANGDTSNAVTATTAVTVNGAKVWSGGASSNAIVSAILNASGGGQVWTTGINSSAVKVSTVTWFNASQAWTNGANSTVFEADSAGGPIAINIDDGAEVWVEGENSVVFDLTASAGSAVGLTVHNSVVGINSQDGEILKIAGSDDDITVTSTNSSFRSGDSVTGPLFSASVETSSATVKIRDFTISGKSNIGITEINKVWTTGDNAVAFDFTHSSTNPAAVGTYFDPKQVWSEGTESGAVRIETVSGLVSLETGAQIWSNGADTATISIRRVAAASSSSVPRSSHNSSDRGQRITFPPEDLGTPTTVELSAPAGVKAEVWAEGLSSSAIYTWLSGINLEDARVWSNSSGGNTVKIVAATLGQQLQVGNGAIVCGGVLSGTACTETAAVNAVHFSIDSESTAGITITTHADGNITGRIELADGADTFDNEGDFTGSGDTGGGDDEITIKSGSTFTLTGNLDLGAGDGDTVTTETGSTLTVGSFMLENAETTPSAGGTGRFRLSSGAQSSPASGGGARFSLSAIDPAPADTQASIDFGEGGNDRFISNGTTVIEGADGFTGLESIKFGEGATLVITADPESVAGDPLINLEGTITASDVEGFNVEVEVPGAHVTEYTIFEADDLPEGEEMQEFADRLSAETGERVSVETDENGNLLLRATSHKDTSLDVYDALIQSAYRSDRNFADKLARGCGISGAASDEISGEFWTGGCVWATSGGRYTRHTSAIEYDEDVYSFTGGVSAPFSGVLVSIAGGYEVSNIDASSETETAADTRGLGKASGDATRFMGGIFAEALVDEFVLDGNLRYGSTSWEATRTAGNSYRADVDATVFGGEIGASRPFLMGEFALFPRVAVGASQITADKFNETSLARNADNTLDADAAMDAFGVDEISEFLVYVSPSIEARTPLNETINMWIKTGADIQVLNPESEIEGRLERDNVPVDGTMDRVMFTYGAGLEYSPYEKFNVSVEYGGGFSSSVDTFIQQFRGGVNYRF